MIASGDCIGVFCDGFYDLSDPLQVIFSEFGKPAHGGLILRDFPLGKQLMID